MKFFLDSSFFFPFIQIEVPDCSQEKLLQIFTRPDLVFCRSELSIFEISAKGRNYVQNESITTQDLIDGINAIEYLPNIEVIPIYHSQIISLALFFSETHSDFIDCLLLASAVNFTDVFISLDETLQQKIEKDWIDEIAKYNDHFQIFLWTQFEHQYLMS
jgi:PIN domain nuclease of toxin-antitoxin system